jgi:rhomboid family protein
MSIHDRDYMRGGRPFVDGTSWTIRLLIILVSVFVLQAVFPPLTGYLTLSAPGLLAGKVWTPLTAAFAHADGNHLIGNLIGVYFFGRMVEEVLGSRRFLQLSLATAVLAHIPFLLLQFARQDPTPTLGYSGVVLAYLVFAALRFPHSKVLLFFVLPVPMWLLAILYVGADLSGVMGQVRGSGPGINHMVHLAGAAIGYWAHRRGGLDLPFLDKLGSRPRRNAPPSPLDTEAEVDRLLDKISKKGIGSLSDSERAFLERASKRRR